MITLLGKEQNKEMDVPQSESATNTYTHQLRVCGVLGLSDNLDVDFHILCCNRKQHYHSSDCSMNCL